MKALKHILVFVLLLAAVVAAQDTYYSMFTFSSRIPQVSINVRAAELQASLYPNFYAGTSADRDMRWVAEHDSLVTAFWDANGRQVLHILTELSGIRWREAEFDIYLLRYFPTSGSGDPLILPLGGQKVGDVITAEPGDDRLLLNLLYQLSHRMLAQSIQPEDSIYLTIASHPLMRPGPYRRDNLAMLLAVTTAQNVLGFEPALAAYESQYIKNQLPGYRLLEQYLMNQWIISPNKPLTEWIAEEPVNSELVRAARPPRRPSGRPTDQPSRHIEGLPIKGKLGFTVAMTDNGQLRVDKIDPFRLGYAAGLVEGDIIRRVNGRLVRNHRDLVDAVLSSMDDGGATLQIVREGRTEVVVIRPMLLPSFEEDYDLPYDTLGEAYDSFQPVDTGMTDTAAPGN